MTVRNLVDHRGQVVVLGNELGRGGEGIVFELPASPAMVAKVYHKAPERGQAEKLRAMVESGSQELSKVAAWPVATIHERFGGPTLGLLMPRIAEHKEIHTLYSPAHRKHMFPEADWTFLIRAAMNCAHAFDTVHSLGHVIGDVNQSNILVKKPEALGKVSDATVRLIDCDSYQVAWNGRVYPCGVGVLQYTPPELQGQSFTGLTRTANHDRFGLALLVFHLMFMGRHPFAGKYLGRGEISLEKAIEECRFAFGRSAVGNEMAPPPQSLPLSTLSSDLVSLFERAFGKPAARGGARPTAAEWAVALGNFEKQLKTCPADPGHRYPTHQPTCPWCELMRSGAPNFFIAVAIHRGAPASRFSSFVLTVIWGQIEAIRSPQRAYRRPAISPGFRAIPTVLPRGVPSRVPDLIRVPREVTQITVGVVAIVSVFLFPVICLGVVSKLFLGIGVVSLISVALFSVWWIVLEVIRAREAALLNEEREVLKEAVVNEYRQRYSEWERWDDQLCRLEEQWRDWAAKAQADWTSHKSQLSASVSRYRDLAANQASDLKVLEASAESIQLRAYLQSCYLTDHKITGIGPTRIDVLRSWSIETADDLTEGNIRAVPGFGPTLTQTLLDWKRKVQMSFRFNAAQGIPPIARREIELKYAQLRQKYETELQQGPTRLRVIARDVERYYDQLTNQIRSVIEKRTQAEMDVSMIDADSFNS